jgi:hypothetical protein
MVTLRWGLVGGFRILGSPKMVVLLQLLPPPLFHFLAMRWMALLYHTAPAMMSCLTTGPKQWDQSIIDWNLQHCEPNEPFLFISWLSQVFCYSNGRPTNTSGHHLSHLDIYSHPLLGVSQLPYSYSHQQLGWIFYLSHTSSFCFKPWLGFCLLQRKDFLGQQPSLLPEFFCTPVQPFVPHQPQTARAKVNSDQVEPDRDIQMGTMRVACCKANPSLTVCQFPEGKYCSWPIFRQHLYAKQFRKIQQPDCKLVQSGMSWFPATLGTALLPRLNEDDKSF